MSDQANINYGLVADRNARMAFAQASSEITALKRAQTALESKLNETGYGAASISTMSADITASDIRETSDGLVILTITFPVTMANGTSSYTTFMVLGKGFPKLAVAGSVSYLSAPPSAGSVSCTVLPDGNVKIGITATGSGTFDCVATAVWKRR